jgi:hypothetical protein
MAFQNQQSPIKNDQLLKNDTISKKEEPKPAAALRIFRGWPLAPTKSTWDLETQFFSSHFTSFKILKVSDNFPLIIHLKDDLDGYQQVPAIVSQKIIPVTIRATKIQFADDNNGVLTLQGLTEEQFILIETR